MAASAAAQSEREEMGLLLEHALDLERLQRLAGLPGAPMFTVDEIGWRSVAAGSSLRGRASRLPERAEQIGADAAGDAGAGTDGLSSRRSAGVVPALPRARAAAWREPPRAGAAGTGRSPHVSPAGRNAARYRRGRRSEGVSVSRGRPRTARETRRPADVVDPAGAGARVRQRPLSLRAAAPARASCPQGDPEGRDTSIASSPCVVSIRSSR